jgi:hypothetical protein
MEKDPKLEALLDSLRLELLSLKRSSLNEMDGVAYESLLTEKLHSFSSTVLSTLPNQTNRNKKK